MHIRFFADCAKPEKNPPSSARPWNRHRRFDVILLHTHEGGRPELQGKASARIREFPRANSVCHDDASDRFLRSGAARRVMLVKARSPGKIRVASISNVELMEDFFQGFAQSAKANVHLRALYGRSSHHQVEAIFKAFARALRFAVSATAPPQGPAQHQRAAMKITILDYGAGNVPPSSAPSSGSEQNRSERLRRNALQRRKPCSCLASGITRLWSALDEKKLRAPLVDAIRSGVPFLGSVWVCKYCSNRAKRHRDSRA